MSRNSNGFYQGCDVSDKFMSRWRSGEHIGPARPYLEVWVRRGRLERTWHNNWPNPQFGGVYGKSIKHQWYPDWTVIDNWTQLLGIQECDLDQSFDNNGITTLSLTVDNVQWATASGPGGNYHTRQRGYLWPWYGWTPPGRPGSSNRPNQWYMRLPNAQILIRQGYGSDTAIKTFTGLIDKLDTAVRPDKMTITGRDFGSVLVDSYLFGWNKTKGVYDPVTFAPKEWADSKAWAKRQASQTHHRWIIIEDAVEIVECCLRWAGFKEWDIEPSGTNLNHPVTYDKSHTLMDIINDIATQLGYVFFIGEPTDGPLGTGQPFDDSIGHPVFRRASAVIPERSLPITLTSDQLLTDAKPTHDNKDERYIIRVRGVPNKKVGRKLAGDSIKRVTFTYWPPWIKFMSGVIKQLTYYDVGSTGVLGFQTIQDCMVACMLIAIQIALGRDTATVQTPGNPGFGLDSFAFVDDRGSGVSSRLYITNRKSTMKLGGDGSSQQQSPYGTSATSQNDLLWAIELGGSLIDNPDFEHIVNDYQTAASGGKVISWSPTGWD